jgi:protein TonB
MGNTLQTLDDMVFEHRNKLYGVFELRKSYANSLKMATLLGTAAMLFVTASSFTYFKRQPKAAANEPFIAGPIVTLPPNEDDKTDPPILPPLALETPHLKARLRTYCLLP